MAPKVDKIELLEEQMEEIKELASDIQATQNLGQSLVSNPTKMNTFKAKLSRIDSTWEKFFSTAMKAKRTAAQLEKTAESTQISDLITQTRDSFYEALAAEIPSNEGANTSQDGNSVSGASNNAGFKLPPISLPTFNGDISQWVSYKDIFLSLIHTNNNLSSVQKFHYLKSSLKGLALQSLAAIPITTESYLQAWNVLCKNYDNKRVQAANYLNNIFSYKPMSKTTLSALEKFSNTVLESSLAFKNLELKDPAGFILISYALRLLDSKTREKFESEIGGEELVFTEFVNFIHKQCTILQSEALTIGTRPHSPITEKPRTSRQVFMTTTNSEGINLCPLCNKPHRIYKCDKFLSMTPQKRFKEIKTRLLCVNCLASNHATKTCRSINTCRYCNHKHHSMLHFKQNKAAPSNPTPASTIPDGKNSPKDYLPATETLVQPVQDPVHGAVLSGLMKGDSLVLLGTALARIQDLTGEFHTIRLIIDSGAQRSFITEACVKRLALRQQRNCQALSGFGNIPIEDGKFKVTCVLAPKKNIHPQLQTQAVVVKEITTLMPNTPVPRSVIDYFKEYELADPGFWHPGRIDFLLGADLFGEILSGDSVITAKGYPNAIKSIFGWVITGQIEVPCQQKQVNAMLAVTASLNQLMENFWKIEEVEVPIPAGAEDNYCEEFFTNTHTRTDSGRYMVRLPFKTPSNVILGNSRTTALHRFYKLEARLLKSPTQKQEYSSVFHEYLEKNFMVPTFSEDAYFLPHHGVVKASSTTKLRIVFDASMPTSEGSINDKLITGPKLQADIKNVLLNFRKFPIALTADICKMYLQVLIHPDDRKYQHLFYRFTPSEKVQEYELTRLSFGMSCSPYLALRVLKQLMEDEGSAFPLAVSALQHNLYMDDILTGANTTEEALRRYQELQELLIRGGFELKKWASNASEVIQFIPEDFRDTPIEFTTPDESSLKILGMMWDPKSDKFYYSVRTPSVLKTKRAILSTIARLFDPLGYLAPVLFKAKRLLQRLWELKLKWDESLPTTINTHWERFITELKTLETIYIPRCIMPYRAQPPVIMGFADASNLGYAAAIYLRSQSTVGEVYTYLLAAKTRVAPVKTLSIPRLELSAALLLVTLINSCNDVISQLSPSAIFLFSDSTVVLGWLATPPHKLKVFVANRVVQILQLSSLENWYHISSKDNPSDIASRGIFPASLKDYALWWKGPAWIEQDPSKWPITQASQTSSENLPEIKSDSTLLCTHTYTAKTSEDEWLKNVSSFSKVQRITAYILRFINNSKNNSIRMTGTLSLKEIHKATEVCIKLNQNHFYHKELLLISKEEGDKTQLSSVAPFLDSLGILRVGGRLQNSPLSYEAKYPIILHPKSHFTTKLVDHLHKCYLHAGPQLLHSLIRRQYWIPTARKVIRTRIHQCVTCHRLRVTNFMPFMSSLPASRFEQGRAFINVGVDFAGPFLIKESSKRKAPTTKAYVCLYVCMSVKAVHLELVSQLTTDAFIACLERFVARRGVPARIFSDNATNFVGADRRLKELWNHFRDSGTQERIIEHCNMKQIEWNFIPPASPHFGGLWEAGVKSMKTHLVRVLQDRCLTFEELYTIVVNIEAILNSRPLCPLSASVDDIDALTPGHFLIGGPLVATQELTLAEIPMNRLSRWQLLKRSIQDLWQRWRLEYLNSLQQRVKWRSNTENVTAGTLVLVKEARLPPRCWPAARIIETYPSKDGIIRIVKLKTPTGEYVRPVAQLAPLLPPSEVEPN